MNRKKSFQGSTLQSGELRRRSSARFFPFFTTRKFRWNWNALRDCHPYISWQRGGEEEIFSSSSTKKKCSTSGWVNVDARGEIFEGKSARSAPFPLAHTTGGNSPSPGISLQSSFAPASVICFNEKKEKTFRPNCFRLDGRTTAPSPACKCSIITIDLFGLGDV